MFLSHSCFPDGHQVHSNGEYFHVTLAFGLQASMKCIVFIGRGSSTSNGDLDGSVKRVMSAVKRGQFHFRLNKNSILTAHQ